MKENGSVSKVGEVEERNADFFLKNVYVEAIIREMVQYSSNYLFHRRFTAVEDPGHSARSAGGRLQLNTHTSYVCGFA